MKIQCPGRHAADTKYCVRDREELCQYWRSECSDTISREHAVQERAIGHWLRIKINWIFNTL